MGVWKEKNIVLSPGMEGKAMLNKWKEALDRMIVREEDYRFVQDIICANNRRLLTALCKALAMIFGVLIVLSFFDIGILMEDVPLFLGAFIASLGVAILLWKTPEQNHKVSLIATYLVVMAVMAYGLVVSYRSPEHYTVSFIAMMGIISMTFVDKPERMSLASGIGVVICIGMICVHKNEAIRAADLVNVISYSLLALVGGYITMRMKIHGYVLDKRQEQDIEQGLQRLYAKETEALQLLTAIKATHDMVVCVNLTRNTYRLIGDDSFVIRGDALEGNFDTVIGIHASKVVEEHRQLYVATFSREGLLAAHAAGKREVYLEYQQRDEAGVPHWLGTLTMFIEDPHSTDVTEITISQNIDERVRREEEAKAVLQAERDRAEGARKAKTDFLFQMSHDIRTPMNAIIGFANFIRASNDLETIHNDYVPKLETAGQQLLLLINDVLEMSRIESGKLTFSRGTHDIRTIVADVMTVVQLQAEENRLKLTSDISVEHPVVYCDQNHMNRVIMNLLSNAVKFTPPGGSVSVSLKEKPDAPEGRTAFELKIADTGIGMSPEFLEKVFEPFEREQTSTVSGLQGTGLGLSIVQRIVEAAGDTIEVESVQGQGTVFTLRMALRKGNPAELPETVGQENGALYLEQMAERFRGKRILLVEDNDFNLTIAQVLLENAGFVVETAANGEVAVSCVSGAPSPAYYDAILMDIQMPIMDGYEATRRIRAMADARAQVTIIAVTANAFDSDRENALAAGMDGHIAKPIHMEALYRALGRML